MEPFAHRLRAGLGAARRRSAGHAMKQTLQVRLSQHLALTPQLQQSIRLLQLSTLELHQEVEQMLASNPLLETEEEFSVSTPELAANAPADTGDSAADAASDSGGEAEAPELSGDDFGGTEREDWENGTERDDFDGIRELPSSASGSGSGDDDGERESQEYAETTLAEHLAQQLAGHHLSAEDRAVMQVLIESLNEDGYLEDPLEDLAAALVEDPEDREELLDRLRIALRLLQSLEPAGIGARDLRECLLLQLRQLPASTPWLSEAQRLASDYLDVLGSRDYSQLMRRMKLKEDEQSSRVETRTIARVGAPKVIGLIGRQFRVMAPTHNF